MYSYPCNFWSARASGTSTSFPLSTSGKNNFLHFMHEIIVFFFVYFLSFFILYKSLESKYLLYKIACSEKISSFYNYEFFVKTGKN